MRFAIRPAMLILVVAVVLLVVTTTAVCWAEQSKPAIPKNSHRHISPSAGRTAYECKKR